MYDSRLAFDRHSRLAHRLAPSSASGVFHSQCIPTLYLIRPRREHALLALLVIHPSIHRTQNVGFASLSPSAGLESSMSRSALHSPSQAIFSYCLQIQSYLAVAKPFPTLPRLLIPSHRVAYKPPLLYYGWRAPRDALLAYAKRSKVRSNLRRRKLSELERMINGMIAVNEELGHAIPMDMLGIHLTVIGNQEAFDLVLTMFSNFDLKRRDLPSEDAVERIRKALGIVEAPGWFLAESQWDWEPW